MFHRGAGQGRADGAEWKDPRRGAEYEHATAPDKGARGITPLIRRNRVFEGTRPAIARPLKQDRLANVGSGRCVKASGRRRALVTMDSMEPSSPVTEPSSPAPAPEDAFGAPRKPLHKRIGGGIAVVGVVIAKFAAKFKALLILLPKLKILTTSGSMLV